MDDPNSLDETMWQLKKKLEKEENANPKDMPDWTPSSIDTPAPSLSHFRKHGFVELHDGGNEQLHRHVWSAVRHDGLDSKVVQREGVAEAIRVAMEAAEVPDITKVTDFVPLDVFGTIINKTTILQLLRELRSCWTFSPSQKSNWQTISAQRPPN